MARIQEFKNKNLRVGCPYCKKSLMVSTFQRGRHHCDAYIKHLNNFMGKYHKHITVMNELIEDWNKMNIKI